MSSRGYARCGASHHLCPKRWLHRLAYRPLDTDGAVT